MPVSWMSKQQSCVYTSTFGSKFTAPKTTVEEAVMLRPTPIFVDNMSVVLNATIPGSTLNKET
eukprot:13343734-Ditylum_brightwellii.AAC.1